MKNYLKIIFLISFLLGFLPELSVALTQETRTSTMFSGKTTLFTNNAEEKQAGYSEITKLIGHDFTEKSEIETIAADLTVSAKNPYAASLPMMIYAELGDEKGYQISHAKMLELMAALDKNPEQFDQWMRNTSFKSWMEGRLLLAADSIGNTEDSKKTLTTLSQHLEEKPRQEDSLAFFTWAWGYRAAFNPEQYQLSKKAMMTGAEQVTKNYQITSTSSNLSDALWCWVMNIQGAARAKNKVTYEQIKLAIQKTADKHSIAEALEAGLLRVGTSSDYPAWALAKVRLAAALMGDKALFDEIGAVLDASIAAAKAAGQKAEYAFAILDNQLALLTAEKTMPLELQQQIEKQTM